MWRSFSCGFICALLLISTPPTSFAVSRWLESWWIPAELLRSFSLVHGAHESIIVSESCRLGIFDQIAILTNCGWLGCECKATPSFLSQNLSVTATILQPILDALDVLGLVETKGDAYCLSATSRRFLVGENNVCGISVASNHREVLWRLASIHSIAQEGNLRSHSTSPSFLREREMPPEDGESAIWKVFASQTGPFSKNIAEKVAFVVQKQTMDMGEFLVFDVGCGSGEYLRAIMDVSPSCTAVYVDLDEVLVETRLLHSVWESNHPNSHTVVFQPASLLDNSLSTILSASTKPKIVLINSVLQHLSDDQVKDSLREIVLALQKTCEKEICGYVFVTELVKGSKGSLWSQVSELIPMTAVFNVVLKAITPSGEVRSSEVYIRLGEAAGLSKISQTSLFPMPAAVITFAVHAQ